MAFVPRVHNRECPVANRGLHGKMQRESQARHIERLGRIEARIDNKWGQVSNGVTEPKRATYPHMQMQGKKKQMQDERYAEIELENYLLLTKLSKILERSHNPTKSTREWGGGVRLTANQVPVIDHCIAETTTSFGAAIPSASLNGYGIEAREKIANENRALVRRLQMCRPNVDFGKFEYDFRERERWLAERAHSKRPISANSRGRGSAPTSAGGSRPPSAGAPRQRPRPQSALVRRPQAPADGTGMLTGAGGRPQTRTHRPRTAGPRVRTSPAAPDPDVLRVLDLLTSQMAGAQTLQQMREARDSLMQHEDVPLLSDTHVSLLDADGVEIEVVRAARVPPPPPPPGSAAAAPPAYGEPVLVLVHGGLFMSGSPRAVRHLAARFSAALGVAVVTPRLRLAPEHPYPAALDDLCTAYEWLTTHGVVSGVGGADVGAGPPPVKIGVYAESSGGALALAMLQRRTAQGAAASTAPCCVALASPWLDMTCSGHSFLVNEPHDPVMQRKRMLDMAAVYLGSASPNDPQASPLLAPVAAFAGLPPTLVHVGDTEVLLDDAYTLSEKARAAGVALDVVEWSKVVHAWHGFYPIMPKADAALNEQTRFLRMHLLPAAA